MKKILLVILTGFCQISAAGMIEFRIAAGTAAGPWNTKEEMVVARVGDVVRIFNDDSVDHQLHTFGAPCSHGPAIAPGTAWGCQITREYDPEVSSLIYDHIYGEGATFWIKSVR